METIEKLSREKLPKITVLAGEDLGQYSQAKEKFLKQIGFDSSDLTYSYFDMSAFDKGVFEELLVKSSFDFSDIQKNLAFLKGYKTEGNISSQDITEAIPKSLQDNIFDMTQLLLRGQIQDVRELVHDLRLQGEDEIKLIAVMLGQFRTYLQVKLLSAQGKSEQQIVSSLSDYLSRKVNPFQVRYAIRDSRHLSVAFLKTTIKTLVETDYQIKTGTLDKDYLLDLALLKIASNS